MTGSELADDDTARTQGTRNKTGQEGQTRQGTGRTGRLAYRHSKNGTRHCRARAPRAPAHALLFRFLASSPSSITSYLLRSAGASGLLPPEGQEKKPGERRAGAAARRGWNLIVCDSGVCVCYSLSSSVRDISLLY